jgi:hypothetical protein
VVRTGKRTVYDCVPQTREVMVNVTTFKPVLRTGSRTVYDCVPQTREVMVPVPKTTLVEKKGTRKRLVCATVAAKVQVAETYCETVPYTYKVKVPVYVPTAASSGFSGTCGGCK